MVMGTENSGGAVAMGAADVAVKGDAVRTVRR